MMSSQTFEVKPTYLEFITHTNLFLPQTHSVKQGISKPVFVIYKSVY